MIESTRAVVRASSALNRPPWNRAATIGPAVTASATAAGRVSSIASSVACDWILAAPSRSPVPTWRLIAGRIAVPSAEPMIASGSWFKRSAKPR